MSPVSPDYRGPRGYLYRTRPMPAHVLRAFHVAVHLAKRCGVSFPAGRVEVRAFYGDPNEHIGVTFHLEHPVQIFLNVARARSEREWTETIVHELCHARDGDDPELGLWEHEARAQRFAAEAMRNL
jgi:hypothetical protein